jgi:HAD superfamily hydrolase (TIGR01484 family)
MMQEILLFIDLDDTLFQTRRKNSQGIIPATRTALTGKGSYMTQAQKLFFDLFNESKKVKIIPTTARDLKQYHNTLLSDSARIDTAILYFSGMILEKDHEEKQWQQQIQRAYQQLDKSILQLFIEVKTIIAAHPQFILYNVDDYYITVKAKQDCPIAIRETIFSQLKTMEIEGYFIHQNDRALSLLPQFLNKKFAVQYLIEKYQPSLTLGVGDSLTDLSFMAVCDFRIFPKNTQIETLLNVIKA